MNVTALGKITLRTHMPIGDESIAMDYRIGVLAAINGAYVAFLEEIQYDAYVAAERIFTYLEIEHDGQDGLPVACTAEALRSAGVPEQVLWAAVAHVRREANMGKLGSTRTRSGG